MADQDKKEEIKGPERQISGPKGYPEQRIELKKEGEPAVEKKEISQDEKIIANELRREIEMMELDDNLKAQAEEKAKKIQFLGEKEKIEHLLKIAREKGVVFAIKVAKEMKDPHILDILHDILAKEGYYKDFAR